MSDIKMLKLKNGSQEPEPTVKVAMLAINSEMKKGFSGMLLIYDLREVCLGKKISKSSLQKLQSLSLLDSNGQAHDSIKNIVFSAVTGEGLNMSVSNPLA